MQFDVLGTSISVSLISGFSELHQGKKVCDTALLVHGIHVSSTRWGWLGKRFAKVLALWTHLVTGRELTHALVKEMEAAVTFALQQQGKLPQPMPLSEW